MGQSSSRSGAGPRRPADVGISPEDVQKGHKDLPDTCQGKDSSTEEKTAAEDLTPAPSVVIAWVLCDVADWDPRRYNNVFDDERRKRQLQLAAHSARLLECWESHQEDFPKALAKELSVLFSGGNRTYDQVANFLVRLFGANKGIEGVQKLHISIDSQELWPPLLAEFRRMHEQNGAQEAEGVAPASTRWMLSLLEEMDRTLPRYEVFSCPDNSRAVRKAISPLKAELLKVHGKAIKMEREARIAQNARQHEA